MIAQMSSIFTDEYSTETESAPKFSRASEDSSSIISEARQIRLKKRRRAIPKSLDLQLEFKNLTYTMQPSVKERWKLLKQWRILAPESASASASPRVLLHNISGTVSAGEILAVMGSSGSGKSTLIDAVAQRIAHKSLQGSITLNGEEVKDNISFMRSISAYVMQDDLLFPMLTVKETLRFAAELRLASGAREKETRVNEVIRQLNLSKVENSIIGDEARRGVSGGERRRVSIGKEIVHDPLLLFLDEPTSGLDSANAFTVVETLLHIAQAGSIVMLSVHQPSDRILKLVTTLLLIADGKTIYCGPPRGMRDFFVSIGYDFGQGNTTEPVLDLMQEFQKSQASVSGLADEFKKYSAKLECEKSRATSPPNSQAFDPESLLRPTGLRGAVAASISRGKLVGAKGAYKKQFDDMDTMVQKFANGWLREVYVLASRGLLILRRTPELFVLRWITVLVSGFFMATIFWQLDHTPLGVKERLGFFAFSISTTFYTCADTLPIFLQERCIFMRETAHDSYRVSSYVVAIALINIPYLLALALTFAVVSYWSVGLAGGAHEFFFFVAVMWAAFWAGNSFATFLSAVVTNVIMGFALVVACLAYFLLLSGFFMNRSRIPSYWLWLHYLSVMKYPYEAVLLNEFGGRGAACFETGSQILYGTPFAGSTALSIYVLRQLRRVLQGTAYAHLKPSTCMIDGPAVLRSQSIGLLAKEECLAITVCLGLFYRFLFYAVLRVSSKTKRH